jgi:hypothetical protein
MSNKKVCKQYPNDQYGPCAPDISGKWDRYKSVIATEEGVTTTKNSLSQAEVTQDNLYFDWEDKHGKRIGMLYPVGKCWEAKSVDDEDNGTMTYQITKIKNGKATKMIATYTEAGHSTTTPAQNPRVAIENWYRID